MSGLDRKLALAAATATAFIGLLLSASPVLALSKHVFSTSFAGEGAAALSNPSNVAVDQSTGDLYVTDPANHRVEKFDSAGNFILMFGKEVDATTGGDVCSAGSGDTCKRGLFGSQPGRFTDPRFVAVDNSGGLSGGDVYVGDNALENAVTVGNFDAETVSKFTSSGHLIDAWGDSGQLSLSRVLFGSLGESDRRSRNPVGLTVDRSGNLFVATEERAEHRYQLAEFGQFGALIAIATTPPGLGPIAAVPNGNLLAGVGATVDELTPAGTDLGTLTGTGFTGPPTAIAAQLSDGQAYAADAGAVVRHYGPGCEPSNTGCAPDDSFGAGELGEATGLAVDESSGIVYAADPAEHRVAAFAPAPFLPDVTAETATEPSDEGATLNGEVDPAGAGEVTSCSFEYVDQSEIEAGGFQGAATAACEPATHFSGVEQVHAAISGLTAETTYHYRLAATNANGTEASHGLTFSPHAVIGLTTEPATGVSGEAATLNGSLLGDGSETHYFFEWGETTAYGHKAPQPPEGIGSPSGPNATPLSLEATGLEPNTTYHYRVVAENESSETSDGEDASFTTPPDLPKVSGEVAFEVNSDTAILHAKVNPGSADTVYHAEYGTGECSLPGDCESTPMLGGHAGAGDGPVLATVSLRGLAPGATYHYRVVAENISGTTTGVTRTFTTLPLIANFDDSCANAHVRQQTGAAQLLDCRAYELVSAANAGGYDVESSLVPGQAPLAGYPEAKDRVLYGVHNGGIPGTNHPTNRGVDPYVATRGKEGWSTEYVGVPSNNLFAAGPFSSTPSGASAGLTAFAFGGPEGCSPCFEGGYTGIPVHLPNGELIQGMVAGEGVSTPPPTAKAEGPVAKDLSADGRHLIFGSRTKFAEGGNDETGDVSIYDRDLIAEETHVVSKTPDGETMSGPGPAELDLSADGSHVLIGQQVTEDIEGNPSYHLYMDIDDSEESIDLTPGTTEGALYAGMTKDGSKVFFTTKDQLLPTADEDESADLYMWSEGGEEEGKPLALLSTGTEGTGNTDECEPVANSVHKHWNTTDPEAEDCGVVAVGGGGGVAAGDGSVYFLSPEKLDGSANGTEGAPNLYVARPGGAPRYVTTLESALTKPQPPKLRRVFDRDFGPFAHAAALAVDHASGDLYVLDAGANTVEKFDGEGYPVNFSGSAPYIEANRITGTESGPFNASFFGIVFPTQLAVDQSNGDFYIPDTGNGVVDKFSSSGEYLSQVEVSVPTGAAVDPANGNLYVSSAFGAVYVFDSSGEPISQFPVEGIVGSVAVDSGGTVYVTLLGGGAEAYSSSGKFLRKLDESPSQSVDVDPSNDEVYVDEGEQIARFDSSGRRLETFGSGGALSGSAGVTIDPEGNLYATNSSGAEVAIFKPILAPDQRVDNPTVLDSVSEPEVRHTADFQLTPSGEIAAFPSTLALAGGGEETDGHTSLFRYDASMGKLTCVSCSPTESPSTGDSSFAPAGQSLTGDGRVFFNSADRLSAADTDEKQDVYEWEIEGTDGCTESSPAFDRVGEACVSLISAGTSTFSSGLLGASADGKDAYFFTRDSLAPQDVNGPTMKIYDAREEGGFPYLFPVAGCRASDECHGAASPLPPPLEVGSEAGTPHNQKTGEHCRRGFVFRHNHCVRRHGHGRGAHHHHHRGGRG